eukprot:TRINITY_DN3657_c0_g2_i4.p1 TRINITY_DN3657_c0_g2~~TRINITY_DN3657_c0_g2_i4.p1  ORF type:complete len:376 (-),score=37.20 TRINITY_DN3657_c0_g2_i4:98-1225(-)
MSNVSLGGKQAFRSACSSGTSSRRQLRVKPAKYQEKLNEPRCKIIKGELLNSSKHRTNKSLSQANSIQRLAHSNSVVSGEPIKFKSKASPAIKCTTPRLSSALYIEKYRILEKCKAIHSSRKSSVEPKLSSGRNESSLGLTAGMTAYNSRSNLYDAVPKIDEEDLTIQQEAAEELSSIAESKRQSVKSSIGKYKSSTGINALKGSTKTSLGRYKFHNMLSSKNDTRMNKRTPCANYSTVHANPSKLCNISRNWELHKEKGQVENNDLVTCNSFIKTSRNQHLNPKESTKSFYKGTLHTTRSDKKRITEGRLVRNHLEELYKKALMKCATETKSSRALQKLQGILNGGLHTTRSNKLAPFAQYRQNLDGQGRGMIT